MGRLQNKVALVTGASAGIGRAKPSLQAWSPIEADDGNAVALAGDVRSDRGLDSKSQGNARLYLDGPASTVNGLNCHPVSAAVILSLCSADARTT